MDWLMLKSGSDVRGTAVGEGTVLTEDIAKALGTAFVKKLCVDKGKKAEDITISLGRDSRISGPALLKAAAEGIATAGAKAIDFGMCTTPAMFMSTITEGFLTDGAIMITASHHPWNKNGLKFFTNKGGLEGKEVADLLTKAQAMQAEDPQENGSIRQTPFLPVYMKQLADRIRKGLGTTDEKPLKGLQVAVDAGNGAGGFYADLMESMGASTKGSQFLNPDGYFPNHIPNPENQDAMKSIQKAVLESGADVGVIFDADCDRAAIVDGDGKAINRNRLIALISAILLEEEPGQTIVTDSVTSAGLAEFISHCGGKHYRFKRGYRNVIDEAVRLNREGERCPLAIETSGHAALRENHFLDDGMYLVTVLIIRAMQMKQQGKRLGSMIEDLKEPAESAEIRLNITEKEFRAVGEKTIALVTEHATADPDWHIAPDNREGIRISFDIDGTKDAGWFLLRLSVHDPVMPLNAESDIRGGVREILKKLYDVIRECCGIDLTPLKQAAGEE
jgi:phosphomannomutase